MATTYLISCPPGTDASNCGYGGGATVIEGPSTLQMVIAGESIVCNLAGTTQAVCTQSQTLSGYSTTQLVTTTLGQADITYLPVGVTAGAGKLGPASTGVRGSARSTSGSHGAGSTSTTTTGVVGSISMSTSTPGTGATASMTELASSSSENSATTAVSLTKGQSSVSQTQTANSATGSASSAATRAGESHFSLLAAMMKCSLGCALAVALL